MPFGRYEFRIHFERRQVVARRRPCQQQGGRRHDEDEDDRRSRAAHHEKREWRDHVGTFGKRPMLRYRDPRGVTASVSALHNSCGT